MDDYFWIISSKLPFVTVTVYQLVRHIAEVQISSRAVRLYDMPKRPLFVLR
jgi:hypothetical protein